MKFKELFEMPTYIPGELPVSDVKVMIMSVDTLDREYDMLSNMKVGNMRVAAAIKKNKQSAIIGELTQRDDGVPSLRIMTTLTFHENADLGEAGGTALQVDTVITTDSAKGAGFGYQLYKALLNAGYTLASDNVQYIGGKELWKKIVHRAARDGHSVMILQRGKYLRDAEGNPVIYNGLNVRDDVIWSQDKRSEDHYYTLLVARNVQ